MRPRRVRWLPLVCAPRLPLKLPVPDVMLAETAKYWVPLAVTVALLPPGKDSYTLAWAGGGAARVRRRRPGGETAQRRMPPLNVQAVVAGEVGAKLNHALLRHGVVGANGAVARQERV